MEFGFILVIVFFLALTMIIFKLSKTVLKALTLVLSLLFIALLIGAAFIFYDFYDLKNNFASSQKIAVMKSGDTAVAAMVLSPEKTSFVNQTNLNEYSVLLGDRQYSKILEDRYKLIVVDAALIDDLKEIKVTNNVLPATSVKTIMLSNEEKLKEAVFEEIIKQVFESPTFIFEQYKKGNLFVYRETPVFKAIKFFPSSLFKSAAGKLFEGAKLTGRIVAKKFLEEKF